MTRAELEKYRTVLEAKRKDLENALGKRQDIAIEKAPDAIDEVQLASERELAIRSLDRDSHLLRKVREALGRLSKGSYGVCGNCEEEINSKRLNAVPWTALCIRCQEAADHYEFGTTPTSLESLLQDAA